MKLLIAAVTIGAVALLGTGCKDKEPARSPTAPRTAPETTPEAAPKAAPETPAPEKALARLTLDKPSDVTITRGEVAQVKISIKRENLEGPVSVSFDKLPSGVSVVDTDKKITAEEATFALKAAADAEIVSGYNAQVTASGPGDTAATQPLTITVKAKE
ncbi:MAG: hypothetical protein ABFD92_00755 [Planctomycetaceae bacterium]|nr:hypothetical protein [Planctomycetaceae bacterium]